MQLLENLINKKSIYLILKASFVLIGCVGEKNTNSGPSLTKNQYNKRNLDFVAKIDKISIICNSKSNIKIILFFGPKKIIKFFLVSNKSFFFKQGVYSLLNKVRLYYYCNKKVYFV